VTPKSSAVPDRADIVIVGAGAAGVMAAIWAARSRGARVVALDGASRLGAKILVAGGGRCNVTHHHVDESAYAGSTREQIRRVLQRFDVPRTVAFFRELGVELKREETGKLFPVTDDARTVLDALLRAAHDAGVRIVHPFRIARITTGSEGFLVSEDPSTGARTLAAPQVVLATGGKSLPKTGSDGQGYLLAKGLGHTISPRVFPALVPLTLPRDHFICSLSGVTLDATLELRSASGKHVTAFTNSTLCTHFGLSGPSVLDISRYVLDATAEARERGEQPPVLSINWLPHLDGPSLEARLVAQASRRGAPPVAGILRDRLPERLVSALLGYAGIGASTMPGQLTREQRGAFVLACTQMPLPITGDRGFFFAEATAGGIPLDQVNLKTMESRRCPGLYLCGEICDVDGRIGGFNFQWAWASGYVAGTGAMAAVRRRS
jgi:predicted Rossmann fold flavoprotein